MNFVMQSRYKNVSANKNNYDYADPMRYVYLNDPSNVPEEELLTEALFRTQSLIRPASPMEGLR